MPRVEVSYDTQEIPNRLTLMAKKKGYKSREEYLRDVLTKVAYEEYESEASALYRQSLEKVVQGLQAVYNTLLLNAELGLLKMPTEKIEREESSDGKNKA
ncbi:hypothetical protein A5819_003600 [Enterococcus sp. 7E2_DIV0204]|uniref:hypothetical protein n=1 Tax=unclassified Enterococcus TaxID=2608891 RepID=UPI000A34667E|nr:MULTISPECIES: hypothetical protein [unclassified Enterococcus]OTN84050.1 hypothetical protein A5819_003600 [Enterococcus sp. 7E2_DIV0204]OTP47262.1 hypothetical protein A5884_003637 [Enterococcus sp. 7D2_DIV0200]